VKLITKSSELRIQAKQQQNIQKDHHFEGNHFSMIPEGEQGVVSSLKNENS
jgi:hypothetical protein